MYCTKCGKALPEGAKYCHHCGEKQAERVKTAPASGKCPSCGGVMAQNENGAVCPYCGYTVQASESDAVKIEQMRMDAEKERRKEFKEEQRERQQAQKDAELLRAYKKEKTRIFSKLCMIYSIGQLVVGFSKGSFSVLVFPQLLCFSLYFVISNLWGLKKWLRWRKLFAVLGIVLTFASIWVK